MNGALSGASVVKIYCGSFDSGFSVLQLRLTIPGLAASERLGLGRALGTLGRFGAAAAELDRVADELPDAEAVTVRAESRSLRARSN